ncbi:MAG: hypothetical protein Q7V17_15760 [Afipia sp.]|nr:hypothetical protein [Afipia sp.]
MPVIRERHDSLDEAMNTLLFIAGVVALSFFAIWAFWFIEKWRGNSAPKVVALTEQIVARAR